MLKEFMHPDFGMLEVVIIEDKEYFAAVDCAKILGYSNPRDAVIRHCRCVVKHDVPHPQSPDKQMEKSFIPEGDLYRLITRAKLAAAEKFERWVFEEVLPSIRKHGAYIPQPVLDNAKQSPMAAINLAYALIAENERQERMQQK